MGSWQTCRPGYYFLHYCIMHVHTLVIFKKITSNQVLKVNKIPLKVLENDVFKGVDSISLLLSSPYELTLLPSSSWWGMVGLLEDSSAVKLLTELSPLLFSSALIWSSLVKIKVLLTLSRVFWDGSTLLLAASAWWPSCNLTNSGRFPIQIRNVGVIRK